MRLVVTAAVSWNVSLVGKEGGIEGRFGAGRPDVL